MSATQSRFHPSRVLPILGFGWLFFLAIDFLGRGMKASFAGPVKLWLEQEGAGLGELGSFVAGILGTALVQSSSSVTSMSVVLTQEGVIPLLVAIGVVHGANLGTSVTSSVVAFFTQIGPGTGRFWHDVKNLLLRPRGEGFERAVGAAVVHDMFNIILVTAILLAVELPFGLLRQASAASADAVAGVLSGSVGMTAALTWLSPSTWTKPVTHALLDVGVPGWALAAAGLPLLFIALKGFARRMKAVALHGVAEDDYAKVGERLLGKTPLATFAVGLGMTILVQSSSATTSMVVPLAAMGLFGVRKIFPFVLGANIGTTTTAVLAAAAGVGEPGFHVGMTVALSHLYLNALAVVLVVTVPGLMTSVFGSAGWLAARSAERPLVLLVYLALLAVAVPVACLALPTALAGALLLALLALLVFGPHVARARAARGGPAEAVEAA